MPLHIDIDTAKGECQKLKENFDSGLTLSYHYRMEQLDALEKMVVENEDQICQALKADLGKPKFEANLCEVDLIVKEIIETKRNLWEWMKPKGAEKDLASIACDLELRRDPLGLTLILGAWNYPFALTVGPLIGSIAGGNVTFLKPPEKALNTSKVLNYLIPKYLDSRSTICYNMVRGGTGQLQQNIDFEHVFFTGGTTVGKIIMKAAARNLCRVTLELGGKNPVYVEDGCDVDYACKRIMWAKNCNAGQICLNADYILCSKNMQDKLIDGFQKAIKKFHPKGQQNSDCYCKLINDGHYNTINDWMERMPKSKLAFGGKKLKKDKFIETTVYKNVSENDPIMEDEIFGPLLGILPIANNVDEAIKFVNKRDKPLGSYIFSNNLKTQEKWLTQTSSGGVCINDIMLHYTCDSLPFGGIGGSGMGNYHGHYSFNCFTHEKGIYKQSGLGKMVMKLIEPPYSSSCQKLLKAAFLGPPFDYKNFIKFLVKMINLGVYIGFTWLAYEKFYKEN